MEEDMIGMAENRQQLISWDVCLIWYYYTLLHTAVDNLSGTDVIHRTLYPSLGPTVSAKISLLSIYQSISST